MLNNYELKIAWQHNYICSILPLKNASIKIWQVYVHTCPIFAGPVMTCTMHPKHFHFLHKFSVKSLKISLVTNVPVWQVLTMQTRYSGAC